MTVNEADVEVKIETAAQRWLANLKDAASAHVGTVRSRCQVANNELEATGTSFSVFERRGAGGTAWPSTSLLRRN